MPQSTLFACTLVSDDFASQSGYARESSQHCSRSTVASVRFTARREVGLSQSSADQTCWYWVCFRYSTVPEYWGKASPYTEGTGFLGTPSNHRDVRILPAAPAMQLCVLAAQAAWDAVQLLSAA